MPILTVNGQSHEVPKSTRLVQAIEASGASIGHRCGGKARCTSCRVTFLSGEPEKFTKAEFAKLGLESGAVPEYRLSCQILCDHDMEVLPLMTLGNQNWSDTGPTVAEAVEPEAEWFAPEELRSE